MSQSPTDPLFAIPPFTQYVKVLPEQSAGLPETAAMPAALSWTAFPNPCSGAARIVLSGRRAAGLERLEVFDAAGRCVAVLRECGQGEARSYTWTGRDALGRPLASGAYFLRPRGAARSLSGRLLIVR